MEVFKKYGPVEVRVCQGFAFADYENQRQADEAMYELEPILKRDGKLNGRVTGSGGGRVGGVGRGIYLHWTQRSPVLSTLALLPASAPEHVYDALASFEGWLTAGKNVFTHTRDDACAAIY